MKQIEFTSRGKKVFGFAHVPESVKKCPAIIMCHGFGAGSSEWNRLFVDFANEAEKRGYYVIRFDCIGSGDSPYDFAENTNLSGWMEDVSAAIDFAVRQKEVDTDHIIGMGLSMGAATTLMQDVEDERISKIVAWAPVIYPEEVFSGLIGKEAYNRLKMGEKRVACISEGFPIELSSKFAQDFSKMDICNTVSCSRKPILVLEGTEDEVINPETTLLLQKANPQYVTHKFIKDEIHGFLLKKSITFPLTFDFLEENN